MEQWEINLRAKLKLELQNVTYIIDGGDGIKLTTGKSGAIEFYVALERQTREYISKISEKISTTPRVRIKSKMKGKSLLSQIKQAPVKKELTIEELKEIIKDITYGKS